MRAALAILLVTALGLGTAFLAACGERNDLLSGDASSSLRGSLDAVSDAVAAGNCTLAEQRAASLRSKVDRLPSSVNRRLRANLQEGARTVSQLASVDCEATTVPATTKRKTTPTTSTTPPPQTEAPPPVTTDETETTAPPPPETQPEPEPQPQPQPTPTPQPSPSPTPPDNGGGARPGGDGNGATPPDQTGGGAPGGGGAAR